MRRVISAPVNGSGGTTSWASATYLRVAAWASSAAIPSGGSTKSTAPAETAARGICGCAALSSSCANVIPPAALIARRPSAPSVIVPDSTTPIARLPFASASERKKASIAICGPRPRRGSTENAPSRSESSVFGEMT